MEVFCIVLLKFSLLCNFLLYRQIRKINAAQVISQNLHRETHQALSDIVDQIDNISSLPPQAPQPPIRPNNFDSLREAFKGPVRVDNERT